MIEPKMMETINHKPWPVYVLAIILCFIVSFFVFSEPSNKTILVDVQEINVVHHWEYQINAEYNLILTNGSVLSFNGDYDHFSKILDSPGTYEINYTHYPTDIKLFVDVQKIIRRMD